MGTRNLTCVILNNEIKVAQYGQWDGYFAGQGQNIVEFILNELNTDEKLNFFKEQIKKCRFYSDDELKFIDNSIVGNAQGYNSEQEKILIDRYPQLSRNTGSDILKLILDRTSIKLKNEYDFGYDGVFCEFAYLLNLDTQELEIYAGYGKEKMNKDERWYSEKSVYDDHKKDGETDIYSVRLFTKIPFNKLTADSMLKLEESREEEYKKQELIKLKKKKTIKKSIGSGGVLQK
jgi:hypothetical protein